jgi:CMP-N-acetylneuraminic acid synthetase
MIKKKIIAEIPARGGSKGVPRKALQRIGGIPLIAYTIRDAINIP